MKNSVTYLMVMLLGVLMLTCALGGLYVHQAIYKPPYIHSKLITVEMKYVKMNPDSGKSEYLIADTNNNVYKDIDDARFNKMNSSDVFVALKLHHKYIIDIVGHRDTKTSQYPNIIDFKAVI